MSSFLAAVLPFIVTVTLLTFWGLRRRRHRALLSALKPGDRILTSAGVVGRVVQVDGEVVTLEGGEKVGLRALQIQIAERRHDGPH